MDSPSAFGSSSSLDVRFTTSLAAFFSFIIFMFFFSLSTSRCCCKLRDVSPPTIRTTSLSSLICISFSLSFRTKVLTFWWAARLDWVIIGWLLVFFLATVFSLCRGLWTRKLMTGSTWSVVLFLMLFMEVLSSLSCCSRRVIELRYCTHFIFRGKEFG